MFVCSCVFPEKDAPVEKNLTWMILFEKKMSSSTKCFPSGEVNRWLIIEELIPDNSRLLKAIFGGVLLVDIYIYIIFLSLDE